MPRVYYSFLQERTGSPFWEANITHYRVIEYHARLRGYHLITMRSLPVAHARNALCQAFYYDTNDPDPDDTLVMLDIDHAMEPDIVRNLARHPHDKGVVVALAVARGEIPFVCFFGANANTGALTNMSEWKEKELVEGVVGGSGAIAIKRWVLEKLIDRAPSWFRYEYGGYKFESTDEMSFGYACANAGIAHWCDTSVVIPHGTVRFAVPEDWQEYIKAHPDVLGIELEGKNIGTEVRGQEPAVKGQGVPVEHEILTTPEQLIRVDAQKAEIAWDKMGNALKPI